MQRYIVEGIGTFLFILVIGLCTIGFNGAGIMAPLAIGAALMVLVYAGGHISGGHYNPAVTIGAWLRGKLTPTEAVPYIISQTIGSVLASFVVLRFKLGCTIMSSSIHTKKSLAGEFIFTFLLVYVTLGFLGSRKSEENPQYGLMAGSTYMLSAYAISGISGCAINPAVALGFTLMGLLDPDRIWIFLFAEILGCVAAAFAHKYMNPDDQ